MEPRLLRQFIQKLLWITLETQIEKEIKGKESKGNGRKELSVQMWGMIMIGHGVLGKGNSVEEFFYFFILNIDERVLVLIL